MSSHGALVESGVLGMTRFKGRNTSTAAQRVLSSSTQARETREPAALAAGAGIYPGKEFNCKAMYTS